MSYYIKEVSSKKELKRFVKFPHKLYRGCEQYVPALDFDEMDSLTESPSLEYCSLKMWLAYNDKDQVVGRIAGIINPHYNEVYNTKRARFDRIEFIEDYDVAKLLFETAEQWAKSEGMDEIHGPLAYNTWGKQGMLVQGYENIPPTNCIYNFPYYKDYVEKYGFEKEIDWIQYELPADQMPAEKLYRIRDMLMARYPLRIIDIKKVKKDKELIDRFFRNYNETFKTVHNYIPLTEHEIAKVGATYIKLLKPELTCMVMDDEDRIASFGIAFPSFSKAYQKAKGRLFPFGWYHILRAYNKYDMIDLMMVGADPHYKSKGVSAIYHVKLAENFRRRGVKVAITNPTIESNRAIKVWDSYQEKELYMIRRTYIKNIK